MKIQFTYEQNTKIIFGRGKVKEVGAIAKEYGSTALLVTRPQTPIFEDTYDQTIALLEDAGLKVIHYAGCVPNPTTESVDMGTEIARKENVDVVIGLGGGSVMDTAKAIAMGAVNPGNAWDYLFFKQPQPQKTLPYIAISTTSGTGSQVTQVSVMTETATQTKSAIYNNLTYPRVAIVDPELMRTMPPHITASTGFDAFCHCFESYISVNATPLTDVIALEGIKNIAQFLKKAVSDGNDMNSREAMAWADTCGGLAIANAGVTLPHGIGMMISGHCPNIMHGESLALVYPQFMKFTYQSALKKFAVVGRIFNKDLEKVSDEDAAAGCCTEIENLMKDIGMWVGFKAFGTEPDMIRKIADRSHDLPDYKANPAVADIETIYGFLMEAYERI